MANTRSHFETGSVSGAGIGLRFKHLDEIIEAKPSTPWFEVLTDNFFGPEGSALQQLDKVRENYPLTMHSVGLSIGAVEPLNGDYIRQLKALADRFQPEWISEHLCWTTAHGVHFHDLLPLPYTEETIKHVSQRIREVQDFLGRQLVIENVSSYLEYECSMMDEHDFVAAIAEEADCYILLDINNVFVSEQNHNIDPIEYIKGMPANRVREMHLAGGEERDGYWLDMHSTPVNSRVWELYEAALEHCGPVPTLIEWDNDIPEFSVLQDQADGAQERMNRICQPTA